jgi:hypothetical protein
MNCFQVLLSISTCAVTARGAQVDHNLDVDASDYEGVHGWKHDVGRRLHDGDDVSAQEQGAVEAEDYPRPPLRLA